MKEESLKKCGQSLKSGKGKGTDTPLVSPERNVALLNPDLEPIRPVSGLMYRTIKKKNLVILIIN